MKKAYIIYSKEEANKNSWFIDRFKTFGANNNVQVELVFSESYGDKELPDFVWNRTRSWEISRFYENKGVSAFHSSQIVQNGNHKGKCLDYLKGRLPGQIKESHWCPKTLQIDIPNSGVSDEQIIQIASLFGEQIVCKTVDGHGGSEVYLLSKDQFDCLKQFAGKTILVQEYIASASRDLRVYVLFGRIYAAVLRQGKDDFRSNYSLGGEVREYYLSREQQEYIEYFISALGGEKLSFVGIDFLIDEQDNLIFNELEEMVGSRMLYQSSDKDIVQDYLKEFYKHL